MFYRVIFLFFVLGSSVLNAFTVKTIADGDWEDPNVWSTHQVPLNPDSIIIYHYVVLNQNRTINAPSVLYVDSLGTICGDYLLETVCGASFVNYGTIFIKQIITRAGLNYNIISFKISSYILGCPPSGSGYFNSLPPNGNVNVWPPALCKTSATNWVGGSQIGVIELENQTLKVYPNPVGKEPLTIITLSDTRMKLMDILGNEIERQNFENKTELYFNTLPPGVYFLELEINGKACVKKIIFLECP